jgi:segregation and condensation protein B
VGPIDPAHLPGALQAVLFVSEEPVPTARLASGLGATEEAVREALRELAEGLAARRAGVVLREVAGGWRLSTAEEYAEAVARFVLDGQSARLSMAALETLAVVAYRQPVSRVRIAAVRGVNVDGVVRTLQLRGLIEERGSDPGSGAILYGTTPLFLTKVGLHSLDELPALAPLLPDIEAVDIDGA